MQWRKSWERSFDEVKYCSDACRRNRLSDSDIALEQEILATLAQQRRGAVIDPEQTIAGDRETVRQAVRRLAARGEVEVVQSGRVVDPSQAKGPIGVRRCE
jgi:ribosomal protein S19E (S16A)